jgi:hypothetical protein
VAALTALIEFPQCCSGNFSERRHLLEDDLGSVADRLNERALAESGGSLWSN